MSIILLDRVYIWCQQAHAVGVMHLSEGWSMTLGGPGVEQLALLEMLESGSGPLRAPFPE